MVSDETLDQLALVMERVQRYTPEQRAAIATVYLQDLTLLADRARGAAEELEGTIIARLRRRRGDHPTDKQS